MTALRIPTASKTICLLAVISSVILALFAAADETSSAQSQSDAQQLEQDKPVKRDLSVGETHHYQVELKADQYARIVVEQMDIDVVVTVYGPDKRKLTTVDRPNGVRGRDEVSVIANADGIYVVELRPFEKASARASYRITVKELRLCVESDRQRIAAEQAVARGEEYRGGETAETMRKAVEEFSRARSLWEALRDPYEEAVALYGLGWSYRWLGEYQQAIHNLGQAITLMETASNRNEEAMARTALAWTYLYTGEYGQAELHFSRALQLHQASNYQRLEAVTLSGMGWLHALTSKYKSALDHFLRSLEIRRQIQDRRGEVLTLSAAGFTHYRLNEKDTAFEYLNRALDLARAMGDRKVEADPLGKLGWVYYSLQRYEQARASFEEALGISRSIGDRSAEADQLYGLASIELRQGRLNQGRKLIEEGLSIIESLRLHSADLQLRSSFLALVQDHYQLYIELLMQQDRLDPAAGHAAVALQVSERASARSLLDSLIESRVDLSSGVDAKLLAEERRLQQQLKEKSSAQMRLLSVKYTPQQAAEVANEINATLGQLQEVRARIKASSPRYAALTQPQLLDAEQIQRELLDEGTLLLKYALGDERSYLWLVSSTGLKTFTLAPRAEIEAQARRVYELMTARYRGEPDETPDEERVRVASADAELTARAATLSGMILGPAAAHLGKKRLLVVAQGALQFIPFGALPEPETSSEGASNLGTMRRRGSPSPPLSPSPLDINHVIVSLPSASTLAALRSEMAGRKPASKKIAIFADPVFEVDDERLMLAKNQSARNEKELPDRGAQRQRPRDLLRAALILDDPAVESREEFYFKRLTYTGWEAERIARYVPDHEALKAIAFDANLDLALSGRLSDYRILHFASHSFIHSAHPDLSGIVLSLVDEQGRQQDGFLRMHQIYNLKLPADLVVLNACRTGLGKEVKGEGLMSLTRGFMYAGAPRVIVSAWPVRDRASAALMAKFYRHLLGPNRMSAAAALRAAKIEMWRDTQWSHPYFWAGFMLQGEWR